MTSIVKDIVTAVEQACWDSNIRVRYHFPVNVLSSSVVFYPRKCAVEVLLTEHLNKERLSNFEHYLTEHVGRLGFEIAGSTYWMPSPKFTGSYVVKLREV